VVQVEFSNSSGVLSANNQSSKALGPVILSSAYQFRGLLSLSDELTMQLGMSSNAKDLITDSLRYQLPLGNQGFMATLGVISSVAKPQASFASLGIQSTVLNSSASGRYPLIRTRSGSLYADFGIASVSSKTSSQGLTLYQESYLTRSASLQVIDLRSALGNTQIGLGVSRANSVNAPYPSATNFDPLLRKYSYNLKHLLSFDSGVFIQVELQGQWANKSLLGGERIAFGGAGIGKGYDPSALVGDIGAGSSLELGWNHNTQLALNNTPGQVQVFGFHDNATAKVLPSDSSAAMSYNLQSSGLGVRWIGHDGVRSSAYLAKPLQNNDATPPHTEAMYFNMSVPW
jgi:hemolysin activation/secretion protein